MIKEKYLVLNFCKGGAFGEVFFGKHIVKEYEVAIKFVRFYDGKIINQSDDKNIEAKRQYENEVEVMKAIKRMAGLRVNGYLSDKKLNYIIMPKYDLDLERLFVQYKRKFKMETVITIGLQVLERLEIMHSCGFKGTPYFASNNQLLKGKLGARDDIESLIYILIYFCQGYLPWARNVQVLGEEIQAQLEVQHVISCRDPDTLCTDLDPEFNAMLTYIQTVNLPIENRNTVQMDSVQIDFNEKNQPLVQMNKKIINHQSQKHNEQFLAQNEQLMPHVAKKKKRPSNFSLSPLKKINTGALNSKRSQTKKKKRGSSKQLQLQLVNQASMSEQNSNLENDPKRQYQQMQSEQQISLHNKNKNLQIPTTLQNQNLNNREINVINENFEKIKNEDFQKQRLNTDDSKSGDIMDQETEENSQMLSIPQSSVFNVNNLKHINLQNQTNREKIQSSQEDILKRYNSNKR
ncbi:protein kinase domain containing protein [Stylonychia lemnae]|uniref:Casein kinase I n=1 Tax=Stylonychia lemnae TaxID=5949 RepID=A0A078B8A5_STYLE|nr:protein kinase domain containing protein [Stylonychia lemnae]|eukprot:CDW90421.1 protein kinase domain containing protein [Stylonychia lemnae]